MRIPLSPADPQAVTQVAPWSVKMVQLEILRACGPVAVLPALRLTIRSLIYQPVLDSHEYRPLNIELVSPLLQKFLQDLADAALFQQSFKNKTGPVFQTSAFGSLTPASNNNARSEHFARDRNC